MSLQKDNTGIPACGARHIACSPRKGVLEINLSECTHVCRYHKFPARRRYAAGLLAPRGMCIDLFHAAYPYCLSLLYGGKFSEPIMVSCPNPEAQVAIRLDKVATKTRVLRKCMVKLSRWLGREIECPSESIVMSVVSCDNAHCLYTFTTGQKFKFNIWLGREVCPATFDAMYPSVHNLLRGGVIPWSEDAGNKIVCPDSKSNITMSVEPKANR